MSMKRGSFLPHIPVTLFKVSTTLITSKLVSVEKDYVSLMTLQCAALVTNSTSANMLVIADPVGCRTAWSITTFHTWVDDWLDEFQLLGLTTMSIYIQVRLKVRNYILARTCKVATPLYETLVPKLPNPRPVHSMLHSDQNHKKLYSFWTLP